MSTEITKTELEAIFEYSFHTIHPDASRSEAKRMNIVAFVEILFDSGADDSESTRRRSGREEGNREDDDDRREKPSRRSRKSDNVDSAALQECVSSLFNKRKDIVEVLLTQVAMMKSKGG